MLLNKINKQRLRDIKSALMCSGTGCETHVKRENKEEQLSTEKQDKAKVAAVRTLYYHSPHACTTSDTWHWCSSFLTIEMPETMELVLTLDRLYGSTTTITGV